MTLDEVRRINDRRLARYGQKYYTEDKVYIGNSDGSLSLIVKDVQNQYNPTAGTGISITGIFPNQTISNTLPDQTVALNSGTGINVTGTYPNFTITNTAATFGILHGTAAGIDTYTVSITGVTSYADGDAYLIRFTNGNTVASPTLNINSLGAITLYRNNDGQLIGGDIVDGAEMLCVYNSTLNVFQCIGTSPNTLFAYVTNGDSVTITKGQPVYAFGGTGDRMVVKLAANTSDATSARTVGLVYSTSIGVNQKGLIITEGLLDGLSIVQPSSGWADGDIVYLGATAGTITRTKPYAPNHLVYLGVVTTASNGSAGRIQVIVQNGYELNEIHDVDVISTPPVNNDVLTYVTGPPNLWKPRSIPTILGYTPVPSTRTLTINGSTQDLSADRTWSVGTVTSVGLTAGTGISLSGTNPITSSGSITVTNSAPDQVVSLTQGGTTTITGTYPNFTISSADQFNGTVTSVAALTLGTSGTDLSSTVANGTTTPAITLNVPTASATNRGALSSTDWTTFNSKQNAITLTTTGTSGAATLIGSTLNIPQYSGGGGGVTAVTGTSPIASSGGTTPDISIANAAANGTTKGAATFTASDFNDNGSGLISIDYTNGQAASSLNKGFLTSTDWSTFNGKQAALSGTGIVQSTAGTISYIAGTSSQFVKGDGSLDSNTYLTTATAASTYVELAGDTMTGLLQFSDTTHAGIRLNNLTTAQRVALTPLSGMLVLDTDLDEFCHYNGAGWEYELNKAVVANVTTTVVAAANITGLSFPVEANSLFLVEGFYSVACSGTGGVKFTQTTPAGATMDILYDGIAGTATTTVKIRSTASGTLTATAINSAATNSGVIVRGFVRTNANAGTLQMQFASNTAGQTSTVTANSWVKITRLS